MVCCTDILFVKIFLRVFMGKVAAMVSVAASPYRSTSSPPPGVDIKVRSEYIPLEMPFFAENPAKNPCSLSKL